jgi:hypothetical protein
MAEACQAYRSRLGLLRNSKLMPSELTLRTVAAQRSEIVPHRSRFQHF